MKFRHNTQARAVKIPLLRKRLGVTKVDIAKYNVNKWTLEGGALGTR
jgi:hypothetical protein